MTNGRAERMVGTIKRAVMETEQNNGVEWPQAAMPVFYRYRRCAVRRNFSTFQFFYEVLQRFSGTESARLLDDLTDAEA